MAVVNAYCTLSEVKSAFRITDTVDDTLLEQAINSASREIDGWCERIFYSFGVATRVNVPTDGVLTETEDLISVSAVKTASSGTTFDTTSATTDYQLEPLNGVSGGLSVPFTRIRAVGDYQFSDHTAEASVQVTGEFGFDAVPTAVKKAAIILSQRGFKRFDTPLGITYDEMGSMRVGRVDPDVEKLLSPWKRLRFA